MNPIEKELKKLRLGEADFVGSCGVSTIYEVSILANRGAHALFLHEEDAYWEAAMLRADSKEHVTLTPRKALVLRGMLGPFHVEMVMDPAPLKLVYHCTSLQASQYRAGIVSQAVEKLSPEEYKAITGTVVAEEEEEET
jgi:hypothetical protein